MSIPASTSISAHPEEREAIEHVYDVIINSTKVLTTVTKHPDAVTRWINAVKDHAHTGRVLRIGFEFEVDKRFNRIGTVQFLVGYRCLVFQLPHAPLPANLNEFIADPNYCFVGIGIKEKMNRLRTEYPFEASPVHCLDLVNILQEYEYAEITDWIRQRLSLIHVLNACTHVFMETSGVL